MATLTLIYGNGDTVTYGNDDVAQEDLLSVVVLCAEVFASE